MEKSGDQNEEIEEKQEEVIEEKPVLKVEEEEWYGINKSLYRNRSRGEVQVRT